MKRDVIKNVIVMGALFLLSLLLMMFGFYSLQSSLEKIKSLESSKSIWYSKGTYDLVVDLINIQNEMVYSSVIIIICLTVLPVFGKLLFEDISTLKSYLKQTKQKQSIRVKL